MKKKAIVAIMCISILTTGLVSCSGNNKVVNDENKSSTHNSTNDPTSTDNSISNNDNTESSPKDETSSDKNSNNPVEKVEPDNSTTPQTPQPVEPPVTPQTPAPVQPPVAPPTPTPAPEVNQGNFMASVEQEIFNIVNAERANAGVPALSYNGTMEKYARIKSADMGDRDYFSHEDPQGNLITSQMKADGVGYNAWGENIAYISGSASGLAQQFMSNWMNSSGHRANILSTNFSGIGIGVYKVGNSYYATQEFYR